MTSDSGLLHSVCVALTRQPEFRQSLTSSGRGYLTGPAPENTPVQSRISIANFDIIAFLSASRMVYVFRGGIFVETADGP